MSAAPESEEPAAAGSGGGGHTVEERLSALETHMKYLATKEDLQKLEGWILGGVIGAGVVSILVALAVARMWQ